MRGARMLVARAAWCPGAFPPAPLRVRGGGCSPPSPAGSVEAGVRVGQRFQELGQVLRGLPLDTRGTCY